MRGKLIIFEAGDGSGKATQAEKLYTRLKADKHRVRKISFPNYKSDAAALIKMYLRGDFGANPAAVNPYAASVFYAVDRYASYKLDWEAAYLDGAVIIADRYTTSNMVHQTAKITGEEEKKEFLRWLWDLEFVKLSLPVPDAVIFLNMPPEQSFRIMEGRVNKFTGKAEKDIHEKDYAYLRDSYKIACELAREYGWFEVDCMEETGLRSVEDIHEEIYARLKARLF
ncbi:MAG TPA: thymidylate kinase [Firmicutes bacterium]|nr:thymidylate kinase [Bacillota bacterium]